MAYKDVKHEYNTVRMEQLNATKQLKRVEDELAALEHQYSALDAKYDKILTSDRAHALQAFRASKTAPIEIKIQETETKLNETKQRYSDEKSKITYDNFLESCSSKQEILEDVRKASTTLEERLQQIVGPRFYSILISSMQYKAVSFSDDNLDKLIEYFNRSEKTIDGFSTGRSATAMIDQVEEQLLGTDESSLQLSSFIAIIILALLLFARKYFMPIIVIFMMTLSVYTVFKNYQIYHMLVVQKAVRENINQIDDFIKKQVEQEVAISLKQLDADFLPRIDKLEKLVTQLQNDLQKRMSEADNEFVYDDSTITREHVAEVDRLDSQKRTLEKQRNEYKELQESKARQVDGLKKKMDTMLADLRNTFFDGIGKEVIFEPTFLLDIDEAENKPKFFEHPQSSCLFLYEDTSDVYNFIRLLSYELRAKISPFSLKVAVSDEAYLGQDMIYFADEQEDKKQSMSAFSIFRDKKETEEFVNELGSDMRKRQLNIRREFDSIASYNRAMVEMGSLAESYIFWFVIDPDARQYDNATIQQVLKIGGSLGIFAHLFISKEEFSKLKETAVKLFDSVEQIYYLEHGEIYKRPVAYVAEDLLK